MMKKLLSISFLVLSLLFVTHTKVQAQNHVKSKVGIGLIYGDEPEAAGLKIDGTFRVTPKVALAPDVSIYFPDDNDTIYNSYWAVNLNGHYIFTADTQYHIYGIGGLNITTIETDLDGGVDNSHTKLGINLGVGGEYHLQDFSLFGEVKYVVSDLDQVVLAVGARLPLN